MSQIVHLLSFIGSFINPPSQSIPRYAILLPVERPWILDFMSQINGLFNSNHRRAVLSSSILLIILDLLTPFYFQYEVLVVLHSPDPAKYPEIIT